MPYYEGIGLFFSKDEAEIPAIAISGILSR